MVGRIGLCHRGRLLIWRFPELWHDDGKGMELSPEDQMRAIIESTNELSEGEPM